MVCDVFVFELGALGAIFQKMETRLEVSYDEGRVNFNPSHCIFGGLLSDMMKRKHNFTTCFNNFNQLLIVFISDKSSGNRDGHRTLK